MASTVSEISTFKNSHSDRALQSPGCVATCSSCLTVASARSCSSANPPASRCPPARALSTVRMPFDGAHLIAEVQHLGSACVTGRHAFKHREHNLCRMQFKQAWLITSGIALRQFGNTAQFLAHAFKEIPVRGHLDDVEAEPSQMKFVEIAVEAGGVMIGCEMRKAPEWGGDNQHAAWSQEARHFVERASRIWQVLQD